MHYSQEERNRKFCNRCALATTLGLMIIFLPLIPSLKWWYLVVPLLYFPLSLGYNWFYERMVKYDPHE